MHPAVYWGIRVGAGLVRKWLSGCDAPSNNIRVSRMDEVALPIETVRDAIDTFLKRLNFELVESDDDEADVYERGDRSIKALPCSRDVAMSDVPTLAAVAYRSEGHGTTVSLAAGPFPDIRFTPAAAAHVKEHLEDLCRHAFGLLRDVAADMASNRAESDRTSRPREDTHALGTQTLADLATLGLGPGASMTQVQSAFRDACGKYHPDRLIGQNLAPHLVELANGRFKEVNAAYHRLKNALAPSNIPGSVWTTPPRGGGSSH